MPIETTKCALCQTAVFRAGFVWEVDSGEQHTPLRCRAYRAANGEGGR